MAAVTALAANRGSKFVVGVFWNALGVIAGLASGLLLSPYLIRKLGADGYGVWALSFALIEYYWLLDLGFRSATIKFVAHYTALGEAEKMSEVVSTSLLYSSGAAAIILVSICLIAPHLRNVFQIAPAYQQVFLRLILIVSASWCCSIVLGVFGASLEAMQRFDLSSRAMIVGTVVRTAGTFALLYNGFGLLALALLAAGAQLLTYALQYRSFRQLFPERRISPRLATLSMLRQMGRFGIHTFFVTISQQFLNQSAPLLIGHFRPAMFVGFYALPTRLLQYTVEMVGKIGVVTNTNAAELAAKGESDSIGKLAIYANRYCLIVFMPMAVLLGIYGKALFLKWVGPEFAGYSAPVLPVLLLGSVIAIVGQFSSTMLLQGLARHQNYAKALMVEAVLGVGVLWFVIPRYGILGAAWASSLFMIANRTLFTSWLTSRVIGMPFLSFLNAIYTAPLLASLPAFALAWWARSSFLPGHTWAQLALAGLMAGVVYYVTAFLLCLPAAHRSIINGWCGRLAALGAKPLLSFRQL